MNKTPHIEGDHTVEEIAFSSSHSKSHRLFRYEETDSTNLRASELIRSGKAREGDVFIARRQSSGRGTKGRSFFCEDGLRRHHNDHEQQDELGGLGEQQKREHHHRQHFDEKPSFASIPWPSYARSGDESRHQEVQ